MHPILSMIQDTSTIRKKVKQYVLQEAFAEKNKIQNDSLIFKEGYFDSMGFMRLITFIEEEFGIKIIDADLKEENFESINAMTDFIDRKTQD